MASLFGSLFNNPANRPTDETIAFNLMAAKAASATAYLTATLDSITPEVRRILHDYTNQIVMEHETLSTLAINKGWFIPYESPMKQLQASFDHTRDLVSDSQQ